MPMGTVKEEAQTDTGGPCATDDLGLTGTVVLDVLASDFGNAV